MSIISILVVLVVVGLLLWAITTAIPMDAQVKRIVQVLVVVVVCLWLLEQLGLIGTWHVGRGALR
jgi:hypothetical protein